MTASNEAIAPATPLSGTEMGVKASGAHIETSNRPRKDDEENDDDELNESVSVSSPILVPPKPFSMFSNLKTAAAVAFPSIGQTLIKLALGSVVALYVLNQNHMLPKPLSAIVSKTLFWPTLPITMSRRVGKWSTIVDDQVVLGGAPFGWLNQPEKLYEDYGVRGVINMCEEYKGPCKKYAELGMEELRLPTTDHFEPTLEDMKSAVAFIKDYEEEGKGKVYVHCRAGHGRSAAIAYVWLLSKEEDPDNIDMKGINAKLCGLRNVRDTLFMQPNVNQFRKWIKTVGKEKKSVIDDFSDEGFPDDEFKASSSGI